MNLNISTLKKQLVGKPKEVGELDGKPVYSMLTKGGLSLVAGIEANGDLKLYGAGSHKKLARACAINENSKIKFTELSKSEELPADVLNRYLPSAQDLTRRMQEALKGIQG